MQPRNRAPGRVIRQSRSRYVQDVGYLCPDNALRPNWASDWKRVRRSLIWWHQKEGFYVPSAFQIDPPARFKVVPASENLARCFGDLDPARQAICFEPTGHVHRVTPYIIDELVVADDSRNNGPGVDANSNLKRAVLICTVNLF